jgi:hypothetical protein
MAEGAMPEVRGDLLGLIEPVVDAEIVINLPAPFMDTGERKVIRVRHG